MQISYKRLAFKHKLWSQWSNISGTDPDWWSSSCSSSKKRWGLMQEPLLHSWHETLLMFNHWHTSNKLLIIVIKVLMVVTAKRSLGVWQFVDKYKISETILRSSFIVWSWSHYCTLKNICEFLAATLHQSHKTIFFKTEAEFHIIHCRSNTHAQKHRHTHMKDHHNKIIWTWSSPLIQPSLMECKPQECLQ
jgi:hypothetical protein